MKFTDSLVMSQNFSDGWAMVNFDTTPIMSTYLIAVAVGPFVSANYTNDVGTIVSLQIIIQNSIPLYSLFKI